MAPRTGRHTGLTMQGTPPAGVRPLAGPPLAYAASPSAPVVPGDAGVACEPGCTSDRGASAMLLSEVCGLVGTRPPTRHPPPPCDDGGADGHALPPTLLLISPLEHPTPSRPAASPTLYGCDAFSLTSSSRSASAPPPLSTAPTDPGTGSGTPSHRLAAGIPAPEGGTTERDSGCTLDRGASAMLLSEVCGLAGSWPHDRPPIRRDPADPASDTGTRTPPRCPGTAVCTFLASDAPLRPLPEAASQFSGQPLAAARPRPAGTNDVTARWRSSPLGFALPRRDALFLARLTRSPDPLTAELASLRLYRPPCAILYAHLPAAFFSTRPTVPLSWEARWRGAAPGPPTSHGTDRAAEPLTVGPNRFAALCLDTCLRQTPVGRLLPDEPAAETERPEMPGSAAREEAVEDTRGALAPANPLHCPPHTSTAPTPTGHHAATAGERPACLPTPGAAHTAPGIGGPLLRPPHHWLRCCSWHLAHAAGLLRLRKALRRAIDEIGRNRLPTPARRRRLFHGLDSGESLALFYRHSMPSATATPPGGSRQHGADAASAASAPTTALENDRSSPPELQGQTRLRPPLLHRERTPRPSVCPTALHGF